MMLDLFQKQLTDLGVGETGVMLLTRSTGVLLIAVLAFFANLIAKRVIIVPARALIGRTRTRRDDILVVRKGFHRLSHNAPAMVRFD